MEINPKTTESTVLETAFLTKERFFELMKAMYMHTARGYIYHKDMVWVLTQLANDCKTMEELVWASWQYGQRWRKFVDAMGEDEKSRSLLYFGRNNDSEDAKSNAIIGLSDFYNEELSKDCQDQNTHW